MWLCCVGISDSDIVFVDCSIGLKLYVHFEFAATPAKVGPACICRGVCLRWRGNHVAC